MYKQFRKNPLWFNILTFAVIVVEFIGIFFVNNAYCRSGAQFTMAIFCCAYGIKERKSNISMSIVFFTLAVPFVYVSLQTLWITYQFKLN